MTERSHIPTDGILLIPLEVNFEEIKSEYDKLIAQISELKSDAAAIKARADSAISHAENPEILKKELNELYKVTKAELRK